MISLPISNLPLTFRQFFKNPFFTRSTSKATHTAQKVNNDLKKASFLIISDDPFTSFVFGRYIEKWNGVVTIASTEIEAIKFIAQNQYKAVLVDVKNENQLQANYYDAIFTAINGKKAGTAIALVDEKSDSLKAALVKVGIKDWLDKEIDPSELAEKLFYYLK